MANESHLSVLRRGQKEWNSWRTEEPSTKPDLSGADLHGLFLTEIDFHATNLAGANLFGCNLQKAEFYHANLDGTDCSEAHLADAKFAEAALTNANFSHANLFAAVLAHADCSNTKFNNAILSDSDFSRCQLTLANFHGADLVGANLSSANLTRTNFQHAKLREANLTRAVLTETYFDECELGGTIFADVNFRTAFGLDTCFHYGPSLLDLQSLGRSGELPLTFMRGCGLPDGLIDYLPSLLNKPFQFYSCFISFSVKDDEFAKRLYADLQNSGVRCWFAPEDMKIGDKIRDRIDQSIRIYDKLLIILSRNSIHSTWVEKEVETAFEEEKTRDAIVLFPIRLDDEVMSTQKAWAADIRRTRHIGDFCNWKTHDSYQEAFARLLRDLRGNSAFKDENAQGNFDDDIPF
ncbi:MAG: toll/interleukin-1 receptor domain-containing protein [Sulfuricaulis sp.]|nr:toll/interleukin-1 receptor domain-containing protein [Sulfuricaulis sp.]